MLAKIAYGFAVAFVGLDNFEKVYLVPTILGQKDDAGRWVGCANDLKLDVGKYFHHVDVSIVNREVIVRIKLFAIFNVPEFGYHLLPIRVMEGVQWLSEETLCPRLLKSLQPVCFVLA